MAGSGAREVNEEEVMNTVRDYLNTEDMKNLITVAWWMLKTKQYGVSTSATSLWDDLTNDGWMEPGKYGVIFRLARICKHKGLCLELEKFNMSGQPLDRDPTKKSGEIESSFHLSREYHARLMVALSIDVPTGPDFQALKGSLRYQGLPNKYVSDPSYNSMFTIWNAMADCPAKIIPNHFVVDGYSKLTTALQRAGLGLAASTVDNHIERYKKDSKLVAALAPAQAPAPEQTSSVRSATSTSNKGFGADAHYEEVIPDQSDHFTVPVNVNYQPFKGTGSHKIEAKQDAAQKALSQTDGQPRESQGEGEKVADGNTPAKAEEEVKDTVLCTNDNEAPPKAEEEVKDAAEAADVKIAVTCKDELTTQSAVMSQPTTHKPPVPQQAEDRSVTGQLLHRPDPAFHFPGTSSGDAGKSTDVRKELGERKRQSPPSVVNSSPTLNTKSAPDGKISETSNSGTTGGADNKKTVSVTEEPTKTSSQKLPVEEQLRQKFGDFTFQDLTVNNSDEEPNEFIMKIVIHDTDFEGRASTREGAEQAAAASASFALELEASAKEGENGEKRWLRMAIAFFRLLPPTLRDVVKDRADQEFEKRKAEEDKKQYKNAFEYICRTLERPLKDIRRIDEFDLSHMLNAFVLWLEDVPQRQRDAAEQVRFCRNQIGHPKNNFGFWTETFFRDCDTKVRKFVGLVCPEKAEVFEKTWSALIGGRDELKEADLEMVRNELDKEDCDTSVAKSVVARYIVQIGSHQQQILSHIFDPSANQSDLPLELQDYHELLHNYLEPLFCIPYLMKERVYTAKQEELVKAEQARPKQVNLLFKHLFADKQSHSRTVRVFKESLRESKHQTFLYQFLNEEFQLTGEELKKMQYCETIFNRNGQGLETLMKPIDSYVESFRKKGFLSVWDVQKIEHSASSAQELLSILKRRGPEVLSTLKDLVHEERKENARVMRALGWAKK